MSNKTIAHFTEDTAIIMHLPYGATLTVKEKSVEYATKHKVYSIEFDAGEKAGFIPTEELDNSEVYNNFEIQLLHNDDMRDEEDI